MKKLILLLTLFSNVAMAEQVKLLTWNVFMLPKPIKFSFQRERTDLIIEEIKKSNDDIIVLQEAFSGDFRIKLKKRTLEQYPYQYYLNRRRFSFTVYGSGVYFLSRYPMKSLGFTYYKDCTTADCFASKGAAVMEVQLPSGKKLHLAGTHLQAGGKDLSREIRMKQLGQIKKLFNDTKVNNVPQFLVGDINIDALQGTDYSKALQFLDMTSGPLEGALGYSNGYAIQCYSKPGDDNKEWLDHVFTQKNGTATFVHSKIVRPYTGLINGKDCPMSDHWGVGAVISL